MQLLIVALLCATQLAVAQSPANPTCNHDNCLRAVIASAFPTRSGLADCQSYFQTSIITTPAVHTVAPTSIPAYASACSGPARYSSACSCVGATATTITLTNSCKNPGVCGTYDIIDSPSCGPLGDCTCATDSSGHSVCVEDEYCFSAVTCTSNASCGAGQVCWTSNCCGVSICATPSNTCSIPSRFVFARLAGMSKKRGGCVQAGSGKCI